MSPRNLQEIYCDCISAAKATSSLIVQNGRLFKWKGQVTSFIVAQLKFRCVPNFGLVIYDDSATVPCLVIDPVIAGKEILNICEKPLLFRDPQFVVEVVVTESKQYDLVYMFIEIGKVSIVHERSDFIESSSDISCSDDGSKSELDTCRLNFIPLKISSVVLSLKSAVFCLVLSLLKYEDDNERANGEEVWLILQNEQVAWKELLLINRIYSITFPSSNSLKEFKNYKSLLSVADKYFDLSFQQMLHHKELIRTNVTTFLPANSQISSCFRRSSETVFEKSFSVTDEHLRFSKFVSVYGTIKEVHYMESWKTLSCPWCDPPVKSHGQMLDNCAVTKNKDEQCSDRHIQSESVSQNRLSTEVNFPNLKFEISNNDKLIGFGIRGGKMNVQITLQDISSEKISYVFLKRWTLEQYPAGLIKGVTVCFTDVNVKHSKKNYVYFVSTPLTRVVYLQAIDEFRFDTLVSWGRFGFPNVHLTESKVWGMLDLDFLAKVSIITKCKLCGQSFSQYRCPNLFCSNNKPSLTNSLAEVNASARLFVRGIHGFEAACLFLKNENVRKYLSLPSKIWEMLCKLSARSELHYSYQTDVSQLEDTDTFRSFFHSYCKYFRPKHRFHVSCKTFKGSVANHDRKYFCVSIEEVDSQRLAVTRAILDENLC